MRFATVAVIAAASLVSAQSATGTATGTAVAAVTTTAGVAAAAATTTAPAAPIDPGYVDYIMGQGKALWAFLPVSIVGTVASLIPFFRNFDLGPQPETSAE